jgi:hypothetical protein
VDGAGEIGRADIRRRRDRILVGDSDSGEGGSQTNPMPTRVGSGTDQPLSPLLCIFYTKARLVSQGSKKNPSPSTIEIRQSKVSKRG